MPAQEQTALSGLPALPVSSESHLVHPSCAEGPLPYDYLQLSFPPPQPRHKDQLGNNLPLIRDRVFEPPLSGSVGAEQSRTFPYLQTRVTNRQEWQPSDNVYLRLRSGYDNDSPSNLFTQNLLGNSVRIEDDGLVAASLDHQNASQYEQQRCLDILKQNQRNRKRGPLTDPTLREQTARTRKMGSCIRCRMQRIRVSTRFVSCDHFSQRTLPVVLSD